MSKVKGWTLPLALATAVVALACSEGGDVTEPGVVVAAITVTPTSAALTSVGETVQFVATPLDASGQPIAGVSVTWSSSNSDVLAIGAEGTGTAVGNGTAVVEARAQTVKGDATVSVEQEVASFTLSRDTIRFESLSDTASVTATGRDSGGTPVPGLNVEWSAVDSTVATVASSGVISSVSPGSTVVTAKWEAFDASVAVSVEQVLAAITVTPTSAALTSVGETVQFVATPLDALGQPIAGVSVSWSSSNSEVLAIGAEGTGTAVGNGSAVVEARVQTVTGEATVSVQQEVASFTLSRDAIRFESLGDTASVTTTGLDSGGTPVPGVDVEWSSEDITVATVAGSGVISSVSPGSTVVTARWEAFDASVAVSVEQVPVDIAILAPRDTLVFLGDTVTLRIEGRDALGHAIPGVQGEWMSHTTAVATIGGGGLVTAVANGHAVIEARVEALSTERSLTVRQVGTALSIVRAPAGARAGIPFEIQPEVEIRDAGGSVVTIDSMTEVTAAMVSGGGELMGTLTVTASAGQAGYSDLAIGGTVGARVLEFGAAGMESVASPAFDLAAGTASLLALSAGDDQTGLANVVLEDSLLVSTVDAWGNGASGVAVQWSVEDGGGALDRAAGDTRDDGTAAVAFTLGRHAGPQVVHATADLDGSPVVFTATATPNATISGVVGTASGHMSAARTELESVATDRPAVGAPDLRSHGVTASRPRRSGGRDLMDPAEPHRPAGFGATEPDTFVPGEVIVTFEATAMGLPDARRMRTMSEPDALAAGDRMREALRETRERIIAEGAPGFQVVGVSPAGLAARVRVDGADGTDELLARLRADRRYRTVERNRLIHRTQAWSSPSDPTVNDPLYPWQAWHYRMIDLPAAWRITTGSPSVIVAVVDDGIRFDHPDIAANLTADGYDFVAASYSYDLCSGGTISRTGDGDGYDPDPTTPLRVIWDATANCVSGVSASGGHGLHVAGTIGATTGDGIGGAGVNWNVSIRPVRVLDINGSGTHYDIAQGILYAAGLPADDGQGGTVQAATAAHVINMSLGGPGGSTVLQQAIEAAAGAGVLLVGAAGNDGTSTPMYPAAYPDVISVSAVTPFGTLASYSSFGSTIELAAPGGAVALGCDFGVVSTVWDFQADVPRWACWQGTSMAAPHVSGVAALVYAQNTGISATQVRTRLRSWAMDAGPEGWDQYFGHGIVNARNSLTQSLEQPGDLHVRLVEAASGRVVATVRSNSNGGYGFDELPDGEYLVFAGQDTEGDGLTGFPGRRWGGFGGSSRPQSVIVDGADVYPASFSIGYPLESPPNHTLADANELLVNSYVRGITAGGQFEVPSIYRIRIAEAGTYVFETSGAWGMCGYALEEDTHLQLHDSTGTSLAGHTDIDFDRGLYCSRIVRTLDPGTYYLAVFGWYGDLRYQLHARKDG